MGPLSESRKRRTGVMGREVVCSRDIGIDSPLGYMYNIINVSDLEMITMMSASEVCNLANPDTFRLEV